jgi:multiple sugar transport system substrate-binding protein
LIRLRGMTWKHTRGLAPMVATAVRFRESHPEISIEWEARSLSDFGEAPVENLAAEYDLVVLDHPYMGELAQAKCFLALDEFLPAEQLREFAADSAGPSYPAYHFGGHQWALPIDAAAQIAGWRADLLEREGLRVPQTWDEVFTLAQVRPGFVSLPLWPLDTLMCFFTLCANVGDPCFTRPGCLVRRETGEYALDMLRRLREAAALQAATENPIAVWERMSSTDETAYCPLAFGYSNYARAGYRANLLSFGLVPSAGKGAVGATLGGAGLAVSARCAHREIALQYASWVASRECQRTLYVHSGGQPASRSAWLDESSNGCANGYFRATLPVLEEAFVRPRHAGFVRFQNVAAEVLTRHLNGDLSAASTLDGLDDVPGRN